MQMEKIKSSAKKRRAKLLAEFDRRGCTIQVMADKHGVSNARMWKLLSKARAENAAAD